MYFNFSPLSNNRSAGIIQGVEEKENIMKNELILIVGSSGTVGSEIGRILKSQGHRVRLTTSKPVESSDGLASINVVTGQGLEAAFEGVSRAFLLSPPGIADQYKVLSPLIQQAQKSGLSKVVLMTAMGANAVETSPFRRAEIELEKSGLKFNIIRPNWFLQNFNTFWVHGIQAAGKIQLPAGSAKTSFIDTRDVAEVAAKLLVDDQFSNKDFDLTGPTAVDHSEVAAAISKVSGRTIAYEDTKPEILKTGLLQAGLPADYVDFMMLIFGFLREGYNARTTDNVRLLTGHEPRGLTAYCADFQKSWSTI